MGAALHDAGKTLHPNEMHGGGNEHERAGHLLLLEQGVPKRVARHAWMHAAWDGQEELEPVLVALADKLLVGYELWLVVGSLIRSFPMSAARPGHDPGKGA